MTKFWITLAILIVIPLGMSGQENQIIRGICVTMEMDSILRAANPKMESLEEFESQLQRDIETYSVRLKSTGAIEEVLTIPVIVHVIHNGGPVGIGPNISTEQIDSQIDAFNEHFRKIGSGANENPVGADIRIEFAPALKDAMGNTLDEPGINRVLSGQDEWSRNDIESTLKPSTSWDPEQYFNIWTLNFGEEDAGLLGYAQFPNSSGLDGLNADEGSASTDGVVMNYRVYGNVDTPFPYNEGKVVSHEVGHWLGLRHVWGDGGCFLDDYCDDTPGASGARWSSALLGCPTDDECGDGLRPVDNYMDYSDDPCKNAFTEDQRIRMRTVMDVSPRRKELKNSNVHLDNNVPVAVFSSDKTSGCEGVSIQFTDESTNSPSTWSWTFYNEKGIKIGESTVQNPQQIFSATGNYDVKLIVSNADGEDETRYDNYIFVISDVLVSTIDEDFEDTETALTNWVVVNPAKDQTFEFSSRSAYGQGTGSIYYDFYTNRGDAVRGIDILISPKMDFSSLNNPYFIFDYAYAQSDELNGDTLSIFYSTDCAETFQPLWSKGGSQLATRNKPVDQAFSPLSSDWDSVQISLASLVGLSEVHFAIAHISGQGNNIYLDNIKVKDAEGTNLPQPVAIRLSDSIICPYDFVLFDDQSPEFPTSWLWTFEGGTPESSTLQYPRIQYQSPGEYDVILTVGNDVGEVTDTFKTFIEVLDKPVISILADNNSLCPGEEVTLTASGALNYTWYDERSVDPVSDETTYTTLFFENRKVYLLGSDIDGCVDTTSILIELEASATISVTPSETVVCEGETVLLTASGGESYLWISKNDTLSTGTTFEKTYTSSEVIGLKGTQTDVCAGFTKAIVTVDKLLAEITKDGSILTASAGESYQWYIGGEEISGAINQIFNAVESGTYTVEVVNENGCSAISEEVFVAVTSVVQLGTSTVIDVFPNPNNGSFSLNISGQVNGVFKYSLFDITGKIILDEEFEKPTEIMKKDIRFSGHSGIYFLRVSDHENFKIIKLIKY